MKEKRPLSERVPIWVPILLALLAPFIVGGLIVYLKTTDGFVPLTRREAP